MAKKLLEVLSGLPKEAVNILRNVCDERVEGAICDVYEDCIIRAASAMMEGGVPEKKVSELLIKYWDLRPSETYYYIDIAIKPKEENANLIDG